LSDPAPISVWLPSVNGMELIPENIAPEERLIVPPPVIVVLGVARKVEPVARLIVPALDIGRLKGISFTVSELPVCKDRLPADLMSSE
jgi:hypothetical protein